ncbi:hypothetical protein BST81_04660 [Leptolyngbya sp. 'hensonii']|nr:hypothetical protein BST81_04660 [Leptolyngbya sp. 'hensonii']
MPALAGQKNSDRASFPGRRIGGGTRGECLMSSQPLVALNPVNNLGITASDRPTVYFAVPKLGGSYPVEFVLQDTDGNVVYETALAAGKTKEIVGIRLPQNSLKVGQDYHWSFAVVCEPEDRSQNLVLSGWLRRVSSQMASSNESSLQARLEQVQSAQKAGVWSDAIATLVELRQAYPDNDKVLRQWAQLLQELELNAVFEPSMIGQL